MLDSALGFGGSACKLAGLLEWRDMVRLQRWHSTAAAVPSALHRSILAPNYDQHTCMH